MKLFLATSFSHQVDAQTGLVRAEFRSFVEALLSNLRKEGAVFAAIEYEGWKISAVPPEIGLQKDLTELDAADVLIALIHDRPSTGVQFEIGYAVARGKRVVLAHQADTTLDYFNQGAVGAGLVTLVSYEDTAGLLTQLILAIHAPTEG